MIADALSAMLTPMRAGVISTPGPEDDYWYYPVGATSSSGVAVTPSSSLQVSAVYGCIRVLRESLGSLPWRVYRRLDERNKEQARDTALWETLHDRPNSWMTPSEFKELGVTHLCLRGNYYCRIILNRGRTELIPMNPDRITIEQNVSGGPLTYIYRDPGKDPWSMPQEQVFHVRGLSLNGVIGLSVIEFAKNVIGAALAQEAHGSSLFENGGLPTFWISRPKSAGKWTPSARDNFRQEWRAVHSGPENAGEPPILGDDMEIHELGLSNQDSQWIQAREFSAEEICRFFGVHPHLIGTKQPHLGNVEQQSIEFVQYTLGPLAVRFEQAADRDLIDDPGTFYTKIVLDALMRADLKSRYESANIAIQGGWKTANEIRSLEDLNPIEGGDEPRFPMNMQPAGGGPDENEQGGQPGKGLPKPAQTAEPVETAAVEPVAIEAKPIRPAFEILIAEASGRLAAQEISYLKRRANTGRGDRERWDEWAEAFYADRFLVYVQKAIDPICAAWEAQTGIKHHAGSIAAIVAKGKAAILNPDRDPVDVLAEWKDTRADEHTRTLQSLFFEVDQ